ncbi:MAG: hypothetical protein ACLFR0_09595 [Alphaproteobacteria bacterium]
MFSLLFSHFKNFRIQKIDYLLRPERIAVRGCFYTIIKFLVAFFTLGFCLNIIFSLISVQSVLHESSHIMLKVLFFVALIPIIILPPVLAINWMDTKWRKREKQDADEYELSLRTILENYRKSEAINPYNKQVIDRILQKQEDLNEIFQNFSAKELALCEDAILYGFEERGIQHAHAYGIKLITIVLILLFFLIFVPLYEFAEYLINAYLPRLKNSIAMIFVLLPVAIFAMWRAMVRAEYYWNILGPHGRNGARNLLFYWPVTFPLLIGLNLWVQELF